MGKANAVKVVKPVAPVKVCIKIVFYVEYTYYFIILIFKYILYTTTLNVPVKVGVILIVYTYAYFLRSK